ncbi:MAG TPA: GNAT family N-acetyltransferase [Anaeromyxobacter sp.]
MQVRPLADADVEAALDLFAAVAAEGLWLATEAPFDRREVRARWDDLVATGEGALLVADDGGAPIGLAAMVGRVEPELGMLVRADRRRQGVGDALVAGCVAWARARGARRVVLHAFPHNRAALALYRKHGFEERGVVCGGYRRRNGERWDAIRMVRELGPERPPGQ